VLGLDADQPELLQVGVYLIALDEVLQVGRHFLALQTASPRDLIGDVFADTASPAFGRVETDDLHRVLY
jgi:hypothetical protein